MEGCWWRSTESISSSLERLNQCNVKQQGMCSSQISHERRNIAIKNQNSSLHTYVEGIHGVVAVASVIISSKYLGIGSNATNELIRYPYSRDAEACAAKSTTTMQPIFVATEYVT